MSMDKNVKGFIDTVRTTASAVGGTVAEVTKEGAKKLSARKEAAKLGMEVLRLRSAIEELYTEIGRKSYAVHMADDEASAEENQIQIDGMYDEITEKEDQIVRLNKRIELINGGISCTVCGRVSPASYDFCPACGTKLEKPEPCCEPESCCESAEEACGCAKDACCEEAEEPCCCGEEKQDCCCEEPASQE